MPFSSASGSSRRSRWLVVHQNSELYGADRVLVDVVTALAADADVLVTVPVTGPLVDVLRDRGVEVRIRPGIFVVRKATLRPRNWPAAAVAFVRSLVSDLRLIRRWRPSDVYVNTVTLPAAVVAARLARRAVVVHVHEAETQMPRLVQRGLLAPLLLASRIVVISPTVQRFLTDNWSRLGPRSVVVQNPVRQPDPAFDALPHQRPEALNVITPGRWSPRKGTDLVIEAAAIARGRGVPVRLTLLGSVYPGYEWYERDLRAQAARLLPDTAFAPFAADPDALWQAQHVTVVPSRVEPYGLVAAESLARGRLTVASAVDGLPEIVTDGSTGILSAPNATALADALERAWTDWPGTLEMAARGPDHARGWTSEAFASRLRIAVGAPAREPASSSPRTVRILGTHGVPAAYGGFETAAENVARFLVGQGWRVIVYCQVDGDGGIESDLWEGIERVFIPVRTPGWRGTSRFDLLSIRHASRHRDLCLTFGYNTAIFNTMQRARRIPNVINMDGIEWSRSRWGPARQAILYTNERIACFVGNHLIADHPEIEKYLRTRARTSKIAMITYGADAVSSTPTEPVTARGLTPGGYATLICRPIPENSVLELVSAFSTRRRGVRLAVLGDFRPDEDSYHRAVVDAASEEVDFLGAIYDREDVTALRFHGLAYLHGHTVGGTNPSLVEALAAGNPVLAHDNPYNRWVAEEAAEYFTDATDAAARLDEILDSAERRERMRAAAVRRHGEEFTWTHVAGQYERLLLRYLPAD